MTTLLQDTFQTKIGEVATWIESSATIANVTGKKVISKSYSIELKAYDLKLVWNPEEMQYERGILWRWFIQKLSHRDEQIKLHCKLVNPRAGLLSDHSSGENFDGIEIENSECHIHIGTEDGEVLRDRAQSIDWMPNRFAGALGFSLFFTEYEQFGFNIRVPKLEVGERIYFHYVVACDQNRPSVDHPNERDLSTWFAIDQTKCSLDKQLGEYSA